jgi:hypothetical protein
VLPQIDTLHTIAEVGIAITGFAGIVAAIRGRDSVSSRPSAADPLAGLLGASLGTVFFCFVPEWIHAATASPDAVWRTALAICGFYRLVYIGLVLKALRGGAGAQRTTPRWITLPGVSLGVLHLVAAAGFFSDFHYFLYLSGLFWGLVISLMHFSTLLLGPSPESRAG